MNTADLTENTARFQFQPLTNSQDDIEALAVNIMGFRFLLFLDAPDLTENPWLREAKFRLGRIEIAYPKSTSWITLSWDDNRAHDVLTLEWVNRR